MQTVILAAAAPHVLTPEAALHVFDRSQLYVCLGTAIATVGLLAAGFSMLRRSLDPLLLWFALFTTLYGVRLVINHQPLWLLGAQPPLLARFTVGIGYLVPIPAFFLFRELRLLNRTSRLLVWSVSPILIVLSLVTLVFGLQPRVSSANEIIVTLTLAIFVFELVRGRSNSADTRLIHRGLTIFLIGALYENLTDYVRLPAFDIEPFAFLVLMAALGIVAGRRTLAREQQLVLIEKELQIAQRIQLSILPGEFPPSRHFRVAALYHPMTAVAGDYFDFLVAGDDEAGILIADVSGHGVPAALIASMVKLAATSQREHAADPAALLAGMNQALCGNTQSQFVTAAYLNLDARIGQLRYAAAAHPPLLLLRDGQVTETVENGLMLAAFPSAEYGAVSAPLHHGDRLVLYTDGLVEAANAAGEEFGSDRLKAAIQAGSAETPAQSAQQLIDAVRAWSPNQADDLTVIVCDYLGDPARGTPLGDC